MKNKTGKFLCIALIQAAPAYCMEHSNNPAIVQLYMATKTDFGINKSEPLSSSQFHQNRIDLTGKLSGNRKLNAQLRKIIENQEHEQAYRIINELEAINVSETRILFKKDKAWINEWLEKLYDIVRITGQQTQKDVDQEFKDEDYGNWNSVVTAEEESGWETTNSELEKLNESQFPDEIVIENRNNNETPEKNYINEPQQESVEYKKAELVDWVTNGINLVTKEEEKNNDSVDIELHVTAEQKQPEIVSSKEIIANDTKVDLTKSIQYVHELDEKTRDAYDKVVEAQKSLENNKEENSNDTKRVEEAQKLVKSLESLDSKKTEAIKTLELEFIKLETKAKENKELVPLVVELKKTLENLKASQKEDKENRSGFWSWFTLSGWFSKKQ